MSVKPHELENREAGLPPRGAETIQAEIAKVRAKAKDEVAERLDALESRHNKLLGRIEAARELRPSRGVDDGRSWGMGRDAAIQAIAGE